MENQIRSTPVDPPKRDLNAPENTVIPKKQSMEVYRPYADTLEDLGGNLSLPSKLSFRCHVQLRDTHTEPFVAKQYHLPPLQQTALEENKQNLLDLGVIEEGPSDWKCSLFVVPQKDNDQQRAQAGWVQTWRVVHDQKSLNIHVLSEKNTLPRIPDIFVIARN